jgi:hypothetical protein
MDDLPQHARPRRKIEQYSEQFIGEVMSEYAEGASSFALSKRFGVSASAIENWARRYGISRGAQVSPNAQQEIGQALVRLVVKQIETHGILLVRAQDPEWFKMQSAGDVALLISTIHEKNIQLLSSLQAGQKQEIERIEMDPDYDPTYRQDGEEDGDGE